MIYSWYTNYNFKTIIINNSLNWESISIRSIRIFCSTNSWINCYNSKHRSMILAYVEVSSCCIWSPRNSSVLCTIICYTWCLISSSCWSRSFDIKWMSTSTYVKVDSISYHHIKWWIISRTKCLFSICSSKNIMWCTTISYVEIECLCISCWCSICIITCKTYSCYFYRIIFN